MLQAGDTTYYYTNRSHTYNPDSAYYWNQEGYIVVPENSPYVGYTALALKNSWWWQRSRAEGWPVIDSIGVRYMLLPINLISYASYLDSYITSNVYSHVDIRCVDEDNDGYYTWGGFQPLHSPDWITNDFDGDDSNPLLGVMNKYGFIDSIGAKYHEPLIIESDSIWSFNRVVPSDIIIPSGVSLTINADLTMCADTKILIQGGRLIVNGGHIRNGHIRNKGNLTIRNGGLVLLSEGDIYEHNPNDLDIIYNGLVPFDTILSITEGGFKRINK